MDKRTFGVGPVPSGNQVFLPLALRFAATDTEGKVQWVIGPFGRGVTEPVITPSGDVVFQTDLGVHRVSPDGVMQWTVAPPRPRWAWHGGPALAGGDVVYLASLNGFYAYSIATNPPVLQWVQPAETGSPFIGAPVIAPDGTVYSFTDTHLFAFWATKPPEPNSPWPMWRHDAQRTGRASP